MRVTKVIAVAVLVLIVAGTLIATVGCGTKYSLTISVTGQGTTNPTVGTHTYGSGQSVTITAAPASGWIFDSWGGAASGTSASTIVIMNADRSVTANFILASITIVDTSITIVSGGTYYLNLEPGYYDVSFTSDDGLTVEWLGGVDQVYNSGVVTSYTKHSVPVLQTTTFELYNPTGVFNNPTALLHLTIVKVQP